ncbi:uncharacterized protein EAE97_009786 [Botrytis byssoidea]|uniref:C2H2-type domain-containing protein n=1 Tax=Botrytis byssoidea TaxID=139641 RepID=A0A9P5LQ85_9HELO|nr:uncharacterized protein EAE97_009786 [Botrytis byssoidea]KAF7928944.1 hypothetical protein EAE97_009786 [Botrytis byssoidea]
MTDTEMNDVFSDPSMEPHDLSQLQYHVTLHDFGERVQKAANAAYPSDQKTKYARVYALLVLWEDEDLQLPVSLEVHELGIVLASIYKYEVQIYRIPCGGSHKKLNQKILDFVELDEDSKEDLKIVYYGGHGMLAQNRQPCWVSRSDTRDPSFSMVKWGGIQNSLEEAQSDVLLLLDCCSSGTANTGEGCGTAELIAACGFNDVANGVGRHSFTYALITELRLLSAYPKFTAAVLYNRILCRLTNWMPEGRELQKAPLHVVLTQNQALPSSIQLSVNPRPKLEPMSFGSPSQSLDSPSPASFEINERTDSDQGSGSSPISSLPSDDEQFPRILLSVRLDEDLVPELSADLFAEWLRMMPVIAKSVTVEAKFRSLSTLILVSMPTPIWVCLGKHPAFNVVGIIKKPSIKVISSSSPSTLEVARSGHNQSLKTKQQPPARINDELPLPAYTRQKSMQMPSSSNPGFNNITPYPSSYHYSTTAAEPYTSSQDTPKTFASETDERPIEKSRRDDQLTQVDNCVADSHKLPIKSAATIVGMLLTKDGEILGSARAVPQADRASTPPAPLTGSLVNNVAPTPRFACHLPGCGMSYLRKDFLDYHMRSHRAPLQSTLEPLAISETKEAFMKHLQIDPETYALMEEESETIYTWLTSDKAHLKDDEIGTPYDWSDFTEYSKNLAMESINKGGTHQTAYYWNLARPTRDCTNWIARWFLYRSFLNEEQGERLSTWPSDLGK